MKRFSLAAIVAATSLGMSAFAADARPAPDFKAKDAEGKEHSLADLKGKVVVLEFTNPGSPVSGQGGCPFMVGRYEKGNMQRLAKKVEELGGVYVAVNSSEHNTAEDTKEIAKKYNVKHPTLIDSEGIIGKAYGAKTTPHMIVIGKDGNIVYDGALNDNNSTDPEKDANAKNYVVLAVEAANKGETPETTKTTPYGCGIKYKK